MLFRSDFRAGDHSGDRLAGKIVGHYPEALRRRIPDQHGNAFRIMRRAEMPADEVTGEDLVAATGFTAIRGTQICSAGWDCLNMSDYLGAAMWI